MPDQTASGPGPTPLIGDRDAARYFLRGLARRAESNPSQKELFAAVLASRIGTYWEPALEIAMQSAERLEEAEVQPVVDEALARSLGDTNNLRLAAELYNRIPLDTLFLKRTSLEVFRQIEDAMEKRKDLHPGPYLITLQSYVLRLVQANEYVVAEPKAAYAVEFARELFAQDPGAFKEGLANSLETLAHVAHGRAQYSVSREAREEEIRILRGAITSIEATVRSSGGEDNDATAEGLKVYEPMLAQCLNNHAGVLKALGDTTGALQYSQESLQVYRRILSRAGPRIRTDFSLGLEPFVEDRRPKLADALIGLSTHQRDAGLNQECLASAQEAFEIFSELSADFPDAFPHQLGMARHNLGMAKFGVSDDLGGLSEMQEAARIYERLVRIDSRAYDPAYAHILGGLVFGYLKNGLNYEALRTAEHSVDLYRKVNLYNPVKPGKELENNVIQLGSLFPEHGERAAELAAELAELNSPIGTQ